MTVSRWLGFDFTTGEMFNKLGCLRLFVRGDIIRLLVTVAVFVLCSTGTGVVWCCVNCISYLFLDWIAVHHCHVIVYKSA